MRKKALFTAAAVAVCALVGLGALPGLGLGAAPDPVGTTSDADASGAAQGLAGRLPELAEMGPGWADAQYQASSESRCPLKAAALYMPQERQTRAFDGGDRFVVFHATRYPNGDAERVMQALQRGGEDCFAFSDDAGAWKTTVARRGDTLTLTMTNTRPNGQVIGIVGVYRQDGDVVLTTLLATYAAPNPTLASTLAQKAG